jgi:hypothetical protein
VPKKQPKTLLQQEEKEIEGNLERAESPLRRALAPAAKTLRRKISWPRNRA